MFGHTKATARPCQQINSWFLKLLLQLTKWSSWQWLQAVFHCSAEGREYLNRKGSKITSHYPLKSESHWAQLQRQRITTGLNFHRLVQFLLSTISTWSQTALFFKGTLSRRRIQKVLPHGYFFLLSWFSRTKAMKANSNSEIIEKDLKLTEKLCNQPLFRAYEKSMLHRHRDENMI